jgi:dTDP-4-dehydrorhamnose reductase
LPEIIAETSLALGVEVNRFRLAAAFMLGLLIWRPGCIVSLGALADEIFKQAAKRGGRSVRVDPTSASDYPTFAGRPSNSRLSTARLALFFAIRPRPAALHLF